MPVARSAARSFRPLRPSTRSSRCPGGRTTRDPNAEWRVADVTDPAVARAGARGRRRRLPPRPLARPRRLRRARPPRRRQRRPRRRRRGRAPDRLPRRARRRGARPLRAPPQPGRDGSAARGGLRPGDHATGGDDRRSRQRRVRDDPSARRPPARDDLPALGARRDAAGRARRRRALPGGRRRAARRPSARRTTWAAPR